jgi:hypothetical protein
MTEGSLLELVRKIKAYPQVVNMFDPYVNMPNHGDIYSITARTASACLGNKDIQDGKICLTRSICI